MEDHLPGRYEVPLTLQTHNVVGVVNGVEATVVPAELEVGK